MKLRIYGVNGRGFLKDGWFFNNETPESAEAVMKALNTRTPAMLWCYILWEVENGGAIPEIAFPASYKSPATFFSDCIILLQEGNIVPLRDPKVIEGEMRTYAQANGLIMPENLFAPTTPPATPKGKPKTEIAQDWYERVDKARLAEDAMQAVRDLSKGNG